MKVQIIKNLYILLSTLPLLTITAQESMLSSFPNGYSPKEIGSLLGNRFVQLNKHTLYQGRWINYMEVCNWLAALQYSEHTGNNKLTKQLKERFEPLFSIEKDVVPPPITVDFSVFGSLSLELYKVTKEQRYFDLGMAYAEAQWKIPVNATAEQKAWDSNGLSWQTRLWIDDMYMLTITQAQAYKVNGKREFIERAAKEMVVYLDSLQRPNGLFYHAPDAPFFWGRGNGWMAAGMTELLKYLPNDNPERTRIMNGYLTMMESLKKYRNSNGLWNQLVDDPECWEETSGSAMFAFAIIAGVKYGWLDSKIYGQVARKAWIALVNHINSNGDITDVCIGTNKQNDRKYYYDRQRVVGDYHGQAAMLWCATTLIE